MGVVCSWGDNKTDDNNKNNDNNNNKNNDNNDNKNNGNNNNKNDNNFKVGGGSLSLGRPD